MSDSFSWVDRKYGVTRELLKILSHYNYPYIVFTRSDLVATDEYMALLNPKLASIQFSISGGNEQLTKKLEPGAPSVKRRLEAIQKLSRAGFWTTVRINPLFPIHPDGYFTDEKSIVERFGSRELAPKFDLFDWNFITQLKEYDVPSLLVGFVRLTPFAIREISKAAETDFSKFFKPENYTRTSDSKFSDLEIAFYYKKIAQECFKNQIRYSTCFIGNGLKDYYQYQNLWTNKTDCCDARGNVAAFKSTSQDIPWKVRNTFAPSAEIAAASETAEIEAEALFQPSVGSNGVQSPAEIGPQL
jgi:DNA repair photolyase